MNHPIKIHRKILKWRWYKEPLTKSVFFHLLITACQDKCLQNDALVTRGEVMTSYRKLADDLGMTVSQIRTSITKLTQTGEIDTIKSKRFTKIILLNYENYQADITATPNFIKHENNNKVFLNMALKDLGWQEMLCMHNNITVNQMKFMLERFFKHIESADDRKPNFKEFKQHFTNWLRYQNVKEHEVKNQDMYQFSWNGQAQMTGTKEQYERAKRTYDVPGFDFKLIKIIKQ